MKKLINFLKKSMLIVLLCLVANTGLSTLPVPNPYSVCGNSIPVPSPEDPMEDYDYDGVQLPKFSA